MADNKYKDITLLDYLDALGYHYRQISADEYCDIQHPDGHMMSSFKYSKSKDVWIYHAGGKRGQGAWGYIREIEGITAPRDIEERLRSVLGMDNPDRAAELAKKSQERRELEDLQRQFNRVNDDGQFHLPPQSPTTNELRAGLCGRRGIDREILEFFIDRGLVYESNTPKVLADGRTVYYHNAIFVGRDKDGVARSAMFKYLQPTIDKETGKESYIGGKVLNSDFKHFVPYYISGSTTDMLICFESFIDGLAFLTLQKRKGRAWDSFSWMSMEGIGETEDQGYASVPLKLKRILDERSDLEKIVFAFDNDQAGQRAAASLTKLLERGHYKCITYLTPASPRKFTHGETNMVKDWCDLCMETQRAAQAEAAQATAQALIDDAAREKN